LSSTPRHDRGSGTATALVVGDPTRHDADNRWFGVARVHGGRRGRESGDRGRIPHPALAKRLPRGLGVRAPREQRRGNHV
jgi:hypothetical protein